MAMLLPSPSSSPMADDSAAPQRPRLPRIRASAREEPEEDATATSALPPRQRGYHGALMGTADARLTTASMRAVLADVDLAERCRWSSVGIWLFYVVTVLTWPSLFVSAMGIFCAGCGFFSCRRPYSIRRLVWAVVFVWMNAMLMLVMCWIAVDQYVFEHDASTAGVNDMYTAVFVLVGTLLYARAFVAARALVRLCKLRKIFFEYAWPWCRRPQEPSPAPAIEESTQEPEPSPSREDGSEQEEIDLERCSAESNVSSVHSFEIDLMWGTTCHEVASPSFSTPATPYKKIEDD